MQSTQLSGRLRAAFGRHASIPLNTRTMLVCFAAFIVLSLSLYCTIEQQITAQHGAQIERLLQHTAQDIRQSRFSGADHLAQTLTPVYFHQGDLNTSQNTRHWPEQCKPLSTDQFRTQFTDDSVHRFHCKDGFALHALQTRLSDHQTERDEIITLWTLQRAQSSATGMNWQDLLGIFLLGLLVSVICGKWINRSIAKPLAEIASSAEFISEGNFDWQLQPSRIREIDQLAMSFNHMAMNLQAREKLIRRTAYKDQLTGLDNRAFLSLALQERTHKAREPLSIVIWGIDNLDSVNEVLGHDVADQVLVKVAKKAKRICSENLVIARLEGNVFCMLVPRKLLENFQSRHSLKRLLQGSLQVSNYQLEIQGHAGLAHYPEHGQCPDSLMRRAEIARQLAKKTRQSSIVFEPRLEQRSAHRLELIAQLRKAINEQEFCLYFQPKLNLRTNSINQAEVLLRWNHPHHGLIAPGSFIELAEQTGMVREITRLVLTKTYGMIDLCANQNMRLSVNLSALDLEDNSIVDFIHALHTSQPDASRHLVLEITESAAMRDPEQALSILNRLAAMNFQIAVDDFGTGYSSLAYLKRFPVTELKIDRSLVQGADLDTDGQIILESTIEMGHIMGLLVTTEGVETQAEYELVKQLGADYVQGFWLSRPMPYDEFKLKHLVGNHDQLLGHV